MLQVLLDRSQSPYAQHLASSSLMKVVTEHTLRCRTDDSTRYLALLCPTTKQHMCSAMACAQASHLQSETLWCWHHSTTVKLEMRNYFLSFLDRFGLPKRLVLTAVFRMHAPVMSASMYGCA